MMSKPENVEVLRALGARIRSLRLAAGLSQSELGGIIDKEQTSIQRLEAGRINPSFLYLSEIANGLGISVNEMLDGF